MTAWASESARAEVIVHQPCKAWLLLVSFGALTYILCSSSCSALPQGQLAEFGKDEALESAVRSMQDSVRSTFFDCFQDYTGAQSRQDCALSLLSDVVVLLRAVLLGKRKGGLKKRPERLSIDHTSLAEAAMNTEKLCSTFKCSLVSSCS